MVDPNTPPPASARRLMQRQRSNSPRIAAADRDSSVDDVEEMGTPLMGRRNDSRSPSHVGFESNPKKKQIGWFAFRNSFSVLVTKCLVLVVLLSFLGYYLLIETSFNASSIIENQQCPIQEWKYPKCSHATYLTDVPTPEYWQELRQAYRNAVSDKDFTLERDTWMDGSANGFRVPVEVRWTPERGRGIYAKEFIPAGTVIWDNRYTARIPDECAARKFVHSLTNQQACDVILWGYPHDHGAGNGKEWSIDLDPCSLNNEANTAKEVNVEERILDPSRKAEPGGQATVAARDIQPGEELLDSYEELRDFDLRNNIFWHVKMVIRSWGFVFLY